MIHTSSAGRKYAVKKVPSCSTRFSYSIFYIANFINPELLFGCFIDNLSHLIPNLSCSLLFFSKIPTYLVIILLLPIISTCRVVSYTEKLIKIFKYLTVYLMTMIVYYSSVV
ncbi:hypothetical protein EB796_018753 [Bugula neritina]|uniref:Uncharacterized protein n=1 Tax=Bugula neritina TaxID=10212 RepID=A0A7J7JAC1_BUGNE|nr:hypothetical protein EB796_018753 [Bugula neritina]